MGALSWCVRGVLREGRLCVGRAVSAGCKGSSGQSGLGHDDLEPFVALAPEQDNNITSSFLTQAVASHKLFKIFLGTHLSDTLKGKWKGASTVQYQSPETSVTLLGIVLGTQPGDAFLHSGRDKQYTSLGGIAIDTLII